MILEKLRTWLEGKLPGELPEEALRQGLTPEALATVRGQFVAEEAKPPRIALIGETGVGKSSTINALFGHGLEISHTRACTQIETEVTGMRGRPVHVFDMPGLGEDVDADEKHYDTYKRVLPTVDLIVWIVKADNRAMTHIQVALERLLKQAILDPARLVVAMNQVDLVQPGTWDPLINLPSPEQEATIRARRDDIMQKLQKVVNLADRQVVAYSATTYYNLDELFESMLGACDGTRRWVLNDRADRADFNSLVAPAVTTSEEK